MSYCRWSTDDFQCDVYLYEAVGGGFCLTLAKHRVIFKDPLPPLEDFSETVKGDLLRRQIIHELIERADRVPIGLSRDGQSFSLDTAEEAIELLLDLRSEGYRFPDYVIEELKEEEWLDE